MKESLLEIICCPIDKAELTLSISEESDDEIIRGSLTCVDCGEAYPIEDGIPNLLPPDMRENTPS